MHTTTLDYNTVLAWLAEQSPEVIDEIITGLATKWDVPNPTTMGVIASQPGHLSKTNVRSFHLVYAVDSAALDQLTRRYALTQVILYESDFGTLLKPASFSAYREYLSKFVATNVLYIHAPNA